MRCFMKRYLIILLLLLAPLFFVHADETDDIVIQKISLLDKSRNSLDTGYRIENDSIFFNTEFKYQDDYVRYQIVVENTNPTDYYKILLSDVEDDNLIYQYTYNDKIMPGAQEVIDVFVQYKNVVPEEVIASSGGAISLQNDANIQIVPETELNNIEEPNTPSESNPVVEENTILNNPITRNPIFVIFVLLVFVLFFYFLKIKFDKVLVFLLFVGLLYSSIGPFLVFANDVAVVTFRMNHEVVLLPGSYRFEYWNTSYGSTSSSKTCVGETGSKTIQEVYDECIRYDCNVYFYSWNGSSVPITDKSAMIVNDKDGYYTCSSSVCLSGEMEVEVYDKKKKKKGKKKLKDVQDDDLILAWDFDEGCYTYVPAVFIKKLEKKEIHLLLTFSDGSFLDVVGEHRIFNLDQNRFTEASSNVDTPIGMKTINRHGDVIELVSKEALYDDVISCCVITEKCFNLYANDILTSVTLNNMYPISNMKYQIEKHDSFTIEELGISPYYYEKFRISELSRLFKGSEEETKKFIRRYISRAEDMNIMNL